MFVNNFQFTGKLLFQSISTLRDGISSILLILDDIRHAMRGHFAVRCLALADTVPFGMAVCIKSSVEVRWYHRYWRGNKLNWYKDSYMGYVELDPNKFKNQDAISTLLSLTNIHFSRDRHTLYCERGNACICNSKHRKSFPLMYMHLYTMWTASVSAVVTKICTAIP